MNIENLSYGVGFVIMLIIIIYFLFDYYSNRYLMKRKKEKQEAKRHEVIYDFSGPVLVRSLKKHIKKNCITLLKKNRFVFFDLYDMAVNNKKIVYRIRFNNLMGKQYHFNFYITTDMNSADYLFSFEEYLKSIKG